jgi:hypothetical protein
MADDNRPTWKPYLAYLERYGARKRAEGEQIIDNDSEEYWRDRERWHQEQQTPKAA